MTPIELSFYEKLLQLPLLGPIINLLKSRKFMVAVITLVVNMLVAQFPALESVQVELIAVLTALGVALMGAIALEDAAAKRNPNRFG